MSWSIRKNNVLLRVTKFAPDVDRPVAGLTTEQRAEHQARRSRETRKVLGFRSPAPCNGVAYGRKADILGSAAGLEGLK